MIRSKSIAGACLAALIAVTGCSSSGSSDSAFNKQDFDVIMGQIVIPALQLLNPFVGVPPLANATAGAAAAAPGGAPNCPVGQIDRTLDYCDSGTACQAPTSGGTTTTFTACVAQGATLNGTWVVDGDTSTLDLTVSVLGLVVATLQGPIVSTAVGECVQEDLGGTEPLTVETGSGSIDIDGLLTYCPDADWPSGSRDLTITEPSSDLLYQMTFNESNLATTVIKDQSSGNVLETCETNLDTKASVCPAPA